MLIDMDKNYDIMKCESTIDELVKRDYIERCK